MAVISLHLLKHIEPLKNLFLFVNLKSHLFLHTGESQEHLEILLVCEHNSKSVTLEGTMLLLLGSAGLYSYCTSILKGQDR